MGKFLGKRNETHRDNSAYSLSMFLKDKEIRNLSEEQIAGRIDNTIYWVYVEWIKGETYAQKAKHLYKYFQKQNNGERAFVNDLLVDNTSINDSMRENISKPYDLDL